MWKNSPDETQLLSHDHLRSSHYFLGGPAHHHWSVLPCVLQYGDKLEKLANFLGMLPHVNGFRGCVSKDKIPPMSRDVQSDSFIVNMQSSNQGDRKGTHWVWLTRMPHCSIYFDPMGVDPPTAVIAAARKPLAVSYQQVQHIQSCQCGYYCVYFGYWLLVKRRSVEDILHHFDQRNLQHNDSILNQFFCGIQHCIV